MLTFPSDSLSQVVCPMDEDAIPPVPVCSEPPLSDPPSPVLPLSSVTPRCDHDGPSGLRRSSRVQDIRVRTTKKLDCADIQASQRQSGPNPSSRKRQRDAADMVQASQSKLKRGGRTRLLEEPKKVGFSIRFTAEHQNKWTISKSTESENIVSPLEGPFVEQTMRNPDTKPEMDSCQELPEIDTCQDFAVGDLGEDASVSKEWVISPFFQSLKSKMASFTEIIMTPVKLFRATSPLSLDDAFLADDETDVDASEKGDNYQTEAQSLVYSAETNVKQLKRKLESSLVSASTSKLLDGLEPMSEAASTSGVNQPSKRVKNSLRSAVKFSVLAKGQEKTKGSQSKNGRGKISVDKVIFGSDPQLPLVHSGLLNEEDEAVVENEQRSSAAMTGETFLKASEISNCSLRRSVRLINARQRRKDSQRKRCLVLHSRMCKTEEGSRSVTVKDADLAATRMRSSETSVSRRLSRSYSCPDVLMLHHDGSPWVSPPHSLHHRTHAKHHHRGNFTHAQRLLRRARRHTVCSVEVEREIAPLCLRKEVYPSRRSPSYDPMTHNLSSSHEHSPCSSLTALASHFLSSPLAFLSKKSDLGASSANAGTSSRVPSPPPSSSCSSALGSSSAASLDHSVDPAQYEAERRQQSEEKADSKDTSSPSQDFENAGVVKHEEGKKVSSIRIRKTLRKPLANLTPMGLPKPVRVKKKTFSLEEIYTNKNFSKPPKSRLETIFEVPLNRKDGSTSWFGPMRVKRSLVFQKVGRARKPRKFRIYEDDVEKTGPDLVQAETRRLPQDKPSLSVQEVDSLLHSKLDELNLWLIQNDEREADKAVPVSEIMT